MSWIDYISDNIKDALFEDDSKNTRPAASSTPVKMVPRVPDPTPVSASAPSASIQVDTSSMDGFIAKLTAALGSSDILDKLNTTMAALPGDDDTRLRTALPVLSGLMSVTPIMLISACQDRLKAIDAESRKFGDAIASKTQLDVDSRSKELQDINTSITKCESDLAGLKQQRDQKQAEMLSSKSRLDAAAANFDRAASILRKSTSDTLNRIKSCSLTAAKG